VVSVEFKLNFLTPCVGDRFIARGKVIKPGRSIFVTQCEVFNVKDGRETLSALMQQSLFVVMPKNK
jgi:acyl-coenzyme A thioesterase PaaI-like protein